MQVTDEQLASDPQGKLHAMATNRSGFSSSSYILLLQLQSK
jgi:hypothetical protein